MRTVFLLAGFAAVLAAQPVVAPTPERTGDPRGEDAGGYNIVHSFELGYRFRDVSGNLNKYRSDVNYGNGIRLLGSSLTVHSKEGHGRYFDELVLTTLGLGNDPYQNAMFRVQKNRLYRYELNWRQQQYFNEALAVSAGQHRFDTTRGLQDHDLLLFPQGNFKLFAGYSRSAQSGPALSTIQQFDATGDEFLLFSNVRRKQDDYRLGGEFRALGLQIHWMRLWEFFKEDTPYDLFGPQQGNNPADRTALTALARAEPYHGSTGGWRAGIARDGKLFAVTGRFTNSGTRRNFIHDERAIGIDRFGSARNRQILLFGTGRRPITTANLTLTLLPRSKVSLINHTGFHSTRMEGDGTYSEFNNATLGIELARFRFLGIRTFTNETTLNAELSRWAGAHAGYQFSDRRIRSIEQTEFFGDRDTLRGSTNNRLHAAIAGIRIRSGPRWSFSLDGEIGRASQPVYQISDRDYHAFRARLQHKTRPAIFTAFARLNYNFNSVAIATHSARARSAGADLSLFPTGRAGVDLGYSRLQLDTLTGIAFFAGPQLHRGFQPYRSDIHSLSAIARLSVARHIDFSAGYTRIQDVAGRLGPERILADPGTGLRAQAAALLATGTAFPLTYDSPLARISFKLHPKVRVNAGYQFYRYTEKAPVFAFQDYRAHTGFSSVLWTF